MWERHARAHCDMKWDRPGGLSHINFGLRLMRFTTLYIPLKPDT